MLVSVLLFFCAAPLCSIVQQQPLASSGDITQADRAVNLTDRARHPEKKREKKNVSLFSAKYCWSDTAVCKLLLLCVCVVCVCGARDCSWISYAKPSWCVTFLPSLVPESDDCYLFMELFICVFIRHKEWLFFPFMTIILHVERGKQKEVEDESRGCTCFLG